MVETAEQLLDQRHLDAGALAAMLDDARRRVERFAAEEDIEVEWERIWSIEPIPFHPELIELATRRSARSSGTSHRLPSGPLHDAAEVARAGVPTVMLFVQSLRGISHNKIEDTRPEHLELSVQALDRLRRRRSTGSRRADVRPRLAARRRGLRHGRPAARDREPLDVAETTLFARYGKPFGLDEKRALLGNAGDALARILERLLDQPGRGRELGEEVTALVIEEVRRVGGGAAARRGGARRRAARPAAARARVELAARARRPRARVLSGLGDAWGAVVCGDEVEQLKPAPDIYLEACRAARRAPGDVGRARGLADRRRVGARGRALRDRASRRSRASCSTRTSSRARSRTAAVRGARPRPYPREG